MASRLSPSWLETSLLAADFSVAATRQLLRPEACRVRYSRPYRKANETAPVPVRQLRALYQMNIDTKDASDTKLTAFVHEGHLFSGPCLPGHCVECCLVEVVGDFEVNVALGLAHTQPGLSSSDVTNCRAGLPTVSCSSALHILFLPGACLLSLCSASQKMGPRPYVS